MKRRRRYLPWIRAAAEELARGAFTNDLGQEATRLLLITAHSSSLGGWSRESLADYAEDIIDSHWWKFWDKFFEFILPCEENVTRAEVQAELQRLGIDVRPLINKVRMALQSAKAKAANKCRR